MPTLCKTEIADNHSVIIQEYVSQFKISMHDFVLVQHLESVHDLLQVVYGFLFIDQIFWLLWEIPFKVSIVTVLHNQIVVVAGLKELKEMHDVRVVDVVHHSHLGF